MAEINLDNLLNGVQGKFWNYNNQQRDNYMPELTGTLVKVSIAQDHVFGHPEQKKYWESDGNPVISLRMHIKDPNGEVYFFDIKPKSTMWFEDIQPACPEGSLSNALGKLIKLSFIGMVKTTGRSVNRNKFQMQILGPGQFPDEGFDSTMPPTRAEAQGMPQTPAVPSPQQYTAQQMVQPQQQAQQMYGQQQMPASLQNAMREAQQAGAMSQAQMIQQQFHDAVVHQPAPAPQAAAGQVPPVDVYDQDIPF